MDVDPQLLRAVRAIADTGSITGAAARLGYSQPAVSQLLRRAEDRLGQPLLVRGARGVRLTPAGSALATHAVRVEAALAAARESVDALSGLTTGTVRLAGFPSASPTLVPPVLARLAAIAPGLTTTYVECEPPEALDLLRAGEVDVALTFTYPGSDAVPDPTVRHRALGVDALALVTPLASGAPVASASASSASASSALSGGSVPVDGPAPVADLIAFREARWIGGCPRCRGHLLASCAASGFAPDIVLETDNAAAVLGLVAAGLGVALLPRLALATTIVPPGVAVSPVSDDLARRVEVSFAAGAERVPSVAAALAAVVALAPAALAA